MHRRSRASLTVALLFGVRSTAKGDSYYLVEVMHRGQESVLRLMYLPPAAAMHDWLLRMAGQTGSKAEVIRGLIVAEMARTVRRAMSMPDSRSRCTIVSSDKTASGFSASIISLMR